MIVRVIAVVAFEYRTLQPNPELLEILDRGPKLSSVILHENRIIFRLYAAGKIVHYVDSNIVGL